MDLGLHSKGSRHMVKKGSHRSSGGPGRPKSKLICQCYRQRRVTEKSVEVPTDKEFFQDG